MFVVEVNAKHSLGITRSQRLDQAFGVGRSYGFPDGNQGNRHGETGHEQQIDERDHPHRLGA